MTDEFLTKGLQEDRYLKALRLVNQFEDEIESLLHELDQRMVNEHSELFDPTTDPDVRTNRSPSNGLAFHRINHSMNGPQAPDSGRPQKLNVHLYWMPPTEYNRTDIDGALRGVGYKVKNADPEIDAEVAKQTRKQDWSLETSGNPYDSNTVFYEHVDSAADVTETTETLVKHFAAFGDAYAIG